MPEEQYTRCPSCRTVFRVTPQQLAMRGGQVRCGHCLTAFDGVAQQVALAPSPERDDDVDPYDEAALGPPTVTLRGAQALLPAASASGGAHEQAETPVATAAGPTAAGAGALAGAKRPPPTPAMAAGEGAPTERPRARRRYAHFAYAVAVPVLALLLTGQAAFHFRESLAARWPGLHPAMVRMCAAFGCTIGAPQEIADLVIAASDLQADPAHQGLLILTATVRNRGPLPLAYPWLELALTDAQDHVVVRRALAPSEYAGGTADLARGIPANGEVAIKLFIDASATAQAGYRLYLFYG